MVAAEGDHFWEGEEGGGGLPVGELEVWGCHLCSGYGVVEGCYGNVAAVEDLRPGEIGIYTCSRVEASEGGLTG